jgi:hypothetical protein
MTTAGAALSDVFARIKAITELPEYQAEIKRIEAENAQDDARRREQHTAARIRVTGVPPEVATTRATDSISRLAVDDFMGGPDALRFLVLSGRKGTGKTFAAAEAVWDHGGRYRDAQQLVAAGMFDRDSTEDMANCRLLVIDELGAEYPNPAFEASLYALLDRRYRMGKRTIICTNLNAADFRTRYCEAGLDRLLDRIKTGGRWVALDGPSLRRHWSEAGEEQP